MKRLSTILLATLLLAGLLAGCASQSVKQMSAEQLVVTASGSGDSTTTEEPPINYFAYQYYINGLMADEMGDYSTAVAAFAKALNYYPGSYQISYSLAEAYARIGEPEKALDVLKKTYPRSADVYRLSAACFRMLDDIDNFHKAYRNVVRLDTTDAEAYSMLASLYLRANDLDSAVWAYESLARTGLGDYRVWNQLGRLYTEKGETNKALDAYRKSLEFDNSPENLSAVVSLADIYQKTNRSDSAASLLEDVVKTDTANTVMLNWLVSHFTEDGKFDRALPYAIDLVAEQPDNVAQKRRLGMIYFYVDSLDRADTIFSGLVSAGDTYDLDHHFLGLIAVRRGNQERARDEFLKVTEMADTLASGWANLGLAYRKLKQPDKEIETYRTGLSRVRSDDEGRVELMFLLGGAQEQNGYTDDAIETFEKLLKLSPDYHPALNYLGYMLADKNERLDYALKLISKAVDLSPENAAYLDSYGWIYYRLGKFDKAVSYLNRAAALDSDPVIFDHLGDAYRAVGKADRAREWWQKALDLKPDDVAIREKLEH